MSRESPEPRRWRRLVDPDARRGALVLYLAFAAVVCFWRLGATGLVSMEGMVADGAAHMLETGEWIVPRVYDEIYTYKPALAYWLAALPLEFVERPPEWLLRLPFAASGFLMGLAVLLLIGRIVGWRLGLISAAASISGILFLQKARLMEFDGALAAGVGVATAAALHNLAAERQRTGLWLLGYAALAAGFLAKGIPALAVFGPGLLAAAAAAGRCRRLWSVGHLAAVLVFAGLVGGYLASAWESAGREAFEQPLLEAQVRGLGGPRTDDLEPQERVDAERFANRDGEPGATPLGAVALALAKPLLIWAAFLPWTVLLPFAWRRAWPQGDAVEDRLSRAATAFLAANALVFMVIPTYETRYFLPLAAPMGILCGLAVGRGAEPAERRSRLLFRVGAGSAGLLAAATALAGAFVFSTPPIPPPARLAIVLAGVVAAAAIFHLARRPVRGRLALLLAIGAGCLMVTEYLGVQPARASKRNLRPQARQLARHLPDSAPVWVLGPADTAGKHASLFFYLGRPIRAFRAGGEPPAAGSYCLLTARQLAELERPGGPGQIDFREIARAEHVWFSYRLGLCQGSGREPAAAPPTNG